MLVVAAATVLCGWMTPTKQTWPVPCGWLLQAVAAVPCQLEEGFLELWARMVVMM
jgi:hypothetical protein